MAPALLLSSPMRATFPQALSFALLGASLVACSAEVDDDDDEVSETSEAELKNAPAGALQIYNMNTHHMSEPGKPSFEATDWRQMLAYMKEQPYLPDIVLLSEVGRNNSVPSQPCVTFVRQLEKTLSKKNKKGESKIEWTCEQASGHVTKLDNSGGGTAVVYRKNLVPLEKKTMVQWTYDKKTDTCIPDPTGPGLSFVQVFKDGNRRVAVAPLHLVSPGAGTSNQYDRDCSDKSLRDVTDAMAKIQADAKIIGGDMNHADAHRTTDAAGVVTHLKWEAAYANAVGYLGKDHKPNAGFKDPWFKDCAATCGVQASDETSYSKEQTQCISACIAKTTSVGRIDWLIAKGANLRENVSIPFADARAAYVRQTADTSAVEKYSDHLAQRMLVVY